ncbi:MAG: hypothetical protein EOM10_15910, partial [Opitutae bacterium]|nr:hypothetical protein [Opitutae bacterium]
MKTLVVLASMAARSFEAALGFVLLIGAYCLAFMWPAFLWAALTSWPTYADMAVVGLVYWWLAVVGIVLALANLARACGREPARAFGHEFVPLGCSWYGCLRPGTTALRSISRDGLAYTRALGMLWRCTEALDSDFQAWTPAFLLRVALARLLCFVLVGVTSTWPSMLAIA